MKYYFKKMFYSLVIIHVLSALIVLLYWYAGFMLACWAARSFDECVSLEIYTNVFFGIIPMLFVVLSGLIIILQQRGRRRMGYLMIPLALIPSFYIGYLLRYAMSWSSVKDWFDAWILSDLFHLATGLILFVMILIPFYVLIKLVREDLFKKRRIAQ